MADLALIVVHSIYIGQIVWTLSASLVMRMRDWLGGVAYIQHCPNPAQYSGGGGGKHPAIPIQGVDPVPYCRAFCNDLRISGAS